MGYLCRTAIGNVLREVREQRKAEVAKLFPPAIFGEQTVLNPYDGFAPASIIADTWVELLGVNKQQLNQFTFSRENIEDVRKKAMVQPNTSKVCVPLGGVVASAVALPPTPVSPLMAHAACSRRRCNAGTRSSGSSASGRSTASQCCEALTSLGGPSARSASASCQAGTASSFSRLGAPCVNLFI